MAKKWTPEEFLMVAEQTNCAPNTLEACRQVLVEGKKSIDVAKDMGMLPSHISRALSSLRHQNEINKVAEMGPSFEKALGKFISAAETDKKLAVSRARETLKSDDLEVKDAVRGEVYIGKPLFRTGMHVVQSLGMGKAVIHELAELERVPNMTYPIMTVAYPKKGGLASVQETEPGQERGGLGR